MSTTLVDSPCQYTKLLQEHGKTDRYQRVILLSDGDFVRFTGVSKNVFYLMVRALIAERARRPAGGRPGRIIFGDKVLIMVEYFRKYSTQFDLAKTYGISESYVQQIITDTEEILIKDKRFHVPGHKAAGDYDNIILLIDVTEVAVQRPKKTKTILFWQEKSAYLQNTNRSREKEGGDNLCSLRQGQGS